MTIKEAMEQRHNEVVEEMAMAIAFLPYKLKWRFFEAITVLN